MGPFRPWANKPERALKILAAFLLITLFLGITKLVAPDTRWGTQTISHPVGRPVQLEEWADGKDEEDVEKATAVRNAMKYTFDKYRENAWGHDDIRPVSGKPESTRNGFGAFIVDSSTTLALMGLWDELALSVEHMLTIDFTTAHGLVDPFETTIRYVGGLASLIDMIDAGLVPARVASKGQRDGLLRQVVTLADKLAPAYDTPTGMPWTRVNFATSKGGGDNMDDVDYYPEDSSGPEPRTHPVIGPARAGTSILETTMLSRLTGDPMYAINSTHAWSSLVWDKHNCSLKGMVDAPRDVWTGRPVNKQKHWDGGHDSYYEYLLKITLLSPPSAPHLVDYQTRFLDAATSLKNELSTHSQASANHPFSHLFIGRQDRSDYSNRMGHLANFAAGTVLLASRAYDRPDLRTFALELLDGIRHTYASTPSQIGPESWNWQPAETHQQPWRYNKGSKTEIEQWEKTGFWTDNAGFGGRPEYVESLFYAWRITGEPQYREWAWEAFSAMERHCKAEHGYAGLRSVWQPSPKAWVDKQESFWAAETLKYLWLTFSQKDVANLDHWVFSTEGHCFRRMG